MKPVLIVFGVVLFIMLQPVVVSAKDSGNAKVIKKLQMMVQEATAERDRIKTEIAKMTADLEQAKKDLEAEKKSRSDLEKKEIKLNNEIAAQKNNAEDLRGRLDSTTAKLREVIDKYNALNQSKNELANQHAHLQETQQFTASELKACESKNVKMFEGAKQVLAGYERCQNKGVLDNLVDSEPVTQIDSVGFEKIIQEYEDKLVKQKFYPSLNTAK